MITEMNTFGRNKLISFNSSRKCVAEISIKCSYKTYNLSGVPVVNKIREGTTYESADHNALEEDRFRLTNQTTTSDKKCSCVGNNRNH